MAWALETGAASAEDQVKDHDQQNEAQSAATVVTNAGAHVVAATAEEKKKDYENKYERHARKSSTGSRAFFASLTRRPSNWETGRGAPDGMQK
jgi:hypothetical protein